MLAIIISYENFLEQIGRQLGKWMTRKEVYVVVKKTAL